MKTAIRNRTGYTRKCLHTALSSALLALVAGPGLALAQTTPSGDEEYTVIEEVIVTAQRREQALQEVPMSVSAFTEAELSALQADNLDSIQGAVPNLNLVQGRGYSSNVNAFIRGVGQPDALQSFDPAVGVYIDDVYIARIQGALFKLYDVERIEVLRGPQGTLYGKNTPGGAIRLITRTPGDEFEAEAGALIGDYGRWAAKGYLSVPMGDDFAMAFSFLHDERDGFVTDPVDGREYNNADSTVARIKGNWDAGDDVNVQFSVDYTKEDVFLTLGRPESLLYTTDFSADFTQVTAVPRLLPPTGEWDFKTTTSLTDRPTQKLDNYGGNLTVGWDINDDVTLKSITAYRKLDSTAYIDIDASELVLGDVFVDIDQKQFSQELQFLGNMGADVNWVAGLYYFNEQVPSHQEAYADDYLSWMGIPITFSNIIDDDLETTSYAAFGQVDWRFAEKWNLGVGLRWTYEEKDYWRTNSTFSNILGNADPSFQFADSDNWSDWTPTVTLDYQITEDVRLYARMAEGFKSGGFNGRANSAADAGTFDPETVWTTEFGAKTIMAGGKLRANYAVFMSKYDDFQARVSVADGPGSFRFPVLNAAELDIKGAEMELTWLPIDPLALSTQIGYLDSEYGKGGFFGADFVEDEPAFSPEWTARFAGTWTQGLANGSDLMFTASANYRDAMWLSVENSPALYEGDYWLLDALVSWVSEDGKWTVSGGIKNLTDEVYRVEGQEFSTVGGVLTAYYGRPKTWTLSVDYRY